MLLLLLTLLLLTLLQLGCLHQFYSQEDLMPHDF
jgi:hypothetical protein